MAKGFLALFLRCCSLGCWDALERLYRQRRPRSTGGKAAVSTLEGK